MIFVTVGSDVPFDRLVRAVDRWARERARADVFAQIGHGGWRPGFISSTRMLEPAEFHRVLTGASVVVAHAGMGTILSALRHSKPILVMPRKGALGETRNEHQLDTARRLHGMKTIHVAYDSGELVGALDRLDGLAPQDPIPPYAQDSLLRALNTFIHGGCVP